MAALRFFARQLTPVAVVISIMIAVPITISMVRLLVTPIPVFPLAVAA
jgi:hypothetical protein